MADMTTDPLNYLAECIAGLADLGRNNTRAAEKLHELAMLQSETIKGLLETINTLGQRITALEART
jgi:hypothetical protein